MDNQRKLLVACFVLWTCFWGTALPSHALISLSLAPSSQDVAIGTQFDVAINIDGLDAGAALGTFDITLGFDFAVLGLANVVFGNQLDLFGLGDIQSVTPGVGTVNLFELSLETENDLNMLQADAFTLATLTFSTLSLASNSALTLSVNALGDAAGNSLDANIQNGDVTVIARNEQVPEPGSIFLVGIGFMVLLVRRKYHLV